MPDEKWQKVRETFDSALRQKPEARRKFVGEACGGDESLLAEVNSLLSSLDSAKSFMETPAVAKLADVIEAETKTLERGKCFGHYEIIRQIGTGGMGDVYLARDKKLDRQVAVKILNERFGQHESDLERFISEAKAASALNHPNILVIHEIGESGDTHFIVSEFIKGKTLREIFNDKTLKLSEVLDVSIQIAGALCTAHEARLVHRDIKPENIMIRPDGYVKILDFGLAKLVERKNKSILGLNESSIRQNQTAKGVILGTVNYMSPEQAKGERVDERTDIFSFGAVIYEMLAGRTPFQGDSISETFANLINAEPQPLVRFVSSVPDKLQRIVSKMLRKNRTERYQTIKGLLTDLKDLRENLTFDEKLERSTSAAAPKVLANRHHSGAGRPGSIPASADWKTDEQSETSDNQTQISEPANAYQAYQLSRYHFQQISPTDSIKSRALLEEAVRFDAGFAPAYAALAEQSVNEAITGQHTPAESFSKAKAALRRAADLNPSSAEFYAAAGFVDLVCDWNFKGAELNLRKSLELNPYYVYANNYLGQVFMFQCRFDEAETYSRRALEIEPMGLLNHNILTIAYFLARNYQKAIEECEKLLAVYPRFYVAAWMRCWVLEQTGRASEAIIEYEKILREPHGELARRWIGYAYALTGDRENALQTAAKIVAESLDHFVSQTHLAALYAALNEPDKAFFYLENALAERDPWMLWIAADPRFDNLRLDSRFDELVRRVGLNEAHTATDLKELRENLSSEENLERFTSPGSKNTTAVFQATTGNANLNTAEVQYSFSESIKQHKPLAALTALIDLFAATGFGYRFFAGRAANTKQIESVAVLPFVNVAADPETEYLSDGISESLIDRLSQLPQLKVIARSSSFKYRGEDIDLQDAAYKLGVQAIITGRVARRGDNLSIRVELIDVRDNRQLWSEQYHRRAADLLIIQQEIAQNVSEKLRLKLSGAQKQEIAKQTTVNPQAYELLLKGHSYRNKKGTENKMKAAAYYQQAMDVDPEYASAYAALSISYSDLTHNSILDPKEFTPKAEAAARKALELDESLAEAHVALALLKLNGWDWAAAEQEYRRALELNPNYAKARRAYAFYLSLVGRHEQAVVEAKRAKDMNPLSPSVNTNIGYALYMARRYDEAQETLSNALEIERENPYTNGILAHTYLGKGMYAEAVTAFQRVIELGGEPGYRIYLGAAYAKSGDRERAAAILKQLETSESYVSPGELAILYVALDEPEQAVAALERAYAAHDAQLQFLLIEPAFDPLRSDRRFQDLMQRVGLADIT